MRYRSLYISLLAIFICFLAGFVRQLVADKKEVGVTIPFTGRLIEQPHQEGQLTHIDIKTQPASKAVTLITRSITLIEYGDVVQVKAGRVFGSNVFDAEFEKVGHEAPLFESFIVHIRELVAGGVEKLYPQPYAGLVLGIAFGLDQLIDPTTKELFLNAGIIHIMVASGYNITLLVGILLPLAKWIGIKWHIIISLLVIVIFVFVTGAGVPIVRAAIMSGGTLFATIVGREKVGYLWLVYSAGCIALINPEAIASVSFQLSFGATLGILLLSSQIETLLRFWPGFLRSDLATTLAAQVFTTPVLIYHFGYYQISGLIVNGLILPVVPWISVLSLINAGAYHLSILFAKIVSVPVIACLIYILKVAEVFT